jgi:hypothetical protein
MSETCALCPRDAREHAAAEREGVVHHQFSTGDLVHTAPPKTEAPQHRTQPPGDPVLRFLLIQAGIITADQLTEAERTLMATGMLQTFPVARNDVGQRS